MSAIAILQQVCRRPLALTDDSVLQLSARTGFASFCSFLYRSTSCGVVSGRAGKNHVHGMTVQSELLEESSSGRVPSSGVPAFWGGLSNGSQ